jgi:hypothetical protein
LSPLFYVTMFYAGAIMEDLTTMYHPYFSPQLTFFFSSYDEGCDSVARKFIIDGVEKTYTTIFLRDSTSVQKAKYEGWLVAPEGSLVEEKKEVVFTAGPKKKSRAKKKK